MTIDTLLFDLDDTLLEYEQRSEDVLAASFDSVGIDPFFDIPEYHDRYDEFLQAGLSVNEQRADCFAAIARDEGYDEETGRAVATAFADVRDHSRVRYLPGLRRRSKRSLGSTHWESSRTGHPKCNGRKWPHLVSGST
ncbi:hypothetical protein [Haladaptatus sp. W1]|uniref:hypothetical protein n=1 Tax=Haladaptatus sp. W1 TaxID=1897478 RepID=UPI000AB9033A|nr:hypothetical protein [Haladaptatus sp. W1]